ncbi:antibiotic biosynthesis monooxygenase [Massilia sp. CFBP9012]|uniref:antibiotic biosynthesis monooxygenase family protein n=1 Tax=Massilia sp. CFBP9012 TaxID=3096531 RepID=UPI002A6B260F|nr:antibiotic biosynthesis monooxygenase [Massilia sp. CFBP9012]MDY0976321.1 antibiotic biosynthesis monooxygenase [Massilia sp. CFBP9012]
MVYEIATLLVRPDRTDAFRHAFADVAHLLTRAKGYRGHLLAPGVELPQQFTLIVRWQTLEDHTPNFETSDDHQMFMAGLQDFLAGEPAVRHIEGAPFSIGPWDATSGK